LKSAVNTIPGPEGTSGGSQSLAAGPDQVALEVPVNASGARPSEVKGQRDIFSEDTTTVLVSENGAVIQLSAAVATGQLLFLTEKKSQREVVCQVVRKRAFRPTRCYVELEFTEEMPDFWGVKFAAKPAAPTNAATQEQESASAAEMVQAAETTEEDAAPPVMAMNAEEVQHLRSEVEELRSQLKSLVERGGGAMGLAGALGPPVAPVASADPGGGETAAPAVQTVPAPPAWMPGKPMIAMKLPKGEEELKAAKATKAGDLDPLKDFLPKPTPESLGAEAAGPPAWTKTIDKSMIPKRGHALRARLQVAGIAVVLLAGLILAGWRLGWLRVPVLGKGGAVAAKTEQRPAPNSTNGANEAVRNGTAATASASGTPNVGTGNAPGTMVSSGAGHIALESAEPATSKSAAMAVTTPVGASEPARTVAAARSEHAAAAPKRVAGAGMKKGSQEVAATPALSEAAEAVMDDGTVLPPKLLKSVSAVYPPQAMRNYITGDVKVDAIVEPDGHIRSMKVLMGPAPLQGAAIEALRQYQYAPATQNGKPVAAHVTVTVKFWFNP
jgi:TonB family protein